MPSRSSPAVGRRRRRSSRRRRGRRRCGRRPAASSSPHAARPSTRRDAADAGIACHGIPPRLEDKWVTGRVDLRTALASRVWLSRTEPGDRARPDRGQEPPLRVSAGISPDFAGTVRRPDSYARGRQLVSCPRDDRTRAARTNRRPATRRAAFGAVARARQHRQRQGQELGRVRRDAARAGARLEGRRGAVRQVAATGRSARRRSAASSASTGARSATASRGTPTTSTHDKAHARARVGGGEAR